MGVLCRQCFVSEGYHLHLSQASYVVSEGETGHKHAPGNVYVISSPWRGLQRRELDDDLVRDAYTSVPGPYAATRASPMMRYEFPSTMTIFAGIPFTYIVHMIRMTSIAVDSRSFVPWRRAMARLVAAAMTYVTRRRVHTATGSSLQHG